MERKSFALLPFSFLLFENRTGYHSLKWDPLIPYSWSREYDLVFFS